MLAISLYHVTRNYGGPEEGGWWYENPNHLRVVAYCENDENATMVCRALNNATPKEREEWHMRPGDDEACDSTGSPAYYVDKHRPGEHELTGIPRYE